MGILFQFFGIYLKESRFNNQQIAYIFMVIPLTHIVITFSLGFFANKLNLKERLLKILTFGSFFFSLFYLFITYLFVDIYLGFIILTIVISIFRNPIYPLIDSITLEYVMKKGEDYGKIRLWGSVGFVFGSLLLGILLDFLPIQTTLYGMSFFLFFCYLSSLKIPVKVIQKTNIRLKEVFNLLKNKNVVLFFLSSFLHIVAFAGYDTFFGIYITKQLGYSTTFVGFCTVAAVFSEVILFNYSRKILSKYPPFRLLAFSYFVTAIRWFVIGAFHDVIPILLSQMIHAFSWGLFFVTAINYIDYLFKDRLRTSGVTLFSTLVFGIGNTVGYVVAGFVSQQYEYAILFFYCGFLALLTFTISLYLSIGEDVTFRLK